MTEKRSEFMHLRASLRPLLLAIGLLAAPAARADWTAEFEATETGKPTRTLTVHARGSQLVEWRSGDHSLRTIYDLAARTVTIVAEGGETVLTPSLDEYLRPDALDDDFERLNKQAREGPPEMASLYGQLLDRLRNDRTAFAIHDLQREHLEGLRRCDVRGFGYTTPMGRALVHAATSEEPSVLETGVLVSRATESFVNRGFSISSLYRALGAIALLPFGLPCRLDVYAVPPDTGDVTTPVDVLRTPDGAAKATLRLVRFDTKSLPDDVFQVVTDDHDPADPASYVRLALGKDTLTLQGRLGATLEHFDDGHSVIDELRGLQLALMRRSDRFTDESARQVTLRLEEGAWVTTLAHVAATTNAFGYPLIHLTLPDGRKFDLRAPTEDAVVLQVNVRDDGLETLVLDPSAKKPPKPVLLTCPKKPKKKAPPCVPENFGLADAVTAATAKLKSPPPAFVCRIEGGAPERVWRLLASQPAADAPVRCAGVVLGIRDAGR